MDVSSTIGPMISFATGVEPFAEVTTEGGDSGATAASTTVASMLASTVEEPDCDGCSIAVGESSIDLATVDSVLGINSSFDVKGSNTAAEVAAGASAASRVGVVRTSLALVSPASLFPLRLALCAEILFRVNKVAVFPPRACRTRSGDLGDIKCSRMDADDTSLKSNGAAGDLSTA
jgi:hypothetical protein